MVEGRGPLELSAMLKDEAAVSSLVAREEDQGTLCSTSCTRAGAARNRCDW
jgi:hypothetical protein